MVTQLCGINSAVECQLPKLKVAGSNPVSRSILTRHRQPNFGSVHTPVHTFLLFGLGLRSLEDIHRRFHRLALLGDVDVGVVVLHLLGDVTGERAPRHRVHLRETCEVREGVAATVDREPAIDAGEFETLLLREVERVRRSQRSGC